MGRKITIKYLVYLYIITLFISGIFAAPVFASETDGTINSTNKYAWGENIGWLNFGTTEGNVHITDSALTGYVWGENIGWISLNCSNDSTCVTVDYKVSNDNEGNLSGYAWSENTGWINFNPTYGGVSIDSSGNFSGYAWGENIGWIIFNCSTTGSCGTIDYKVATDWRLASSRTTEETTTTGGGGSGFTPPSPTAPESGFVFFITPDIATSSKITLHFEGGSDITKIAIADNPDFSPATYINYAVSYNWVLSGEPGEKILYAKFCNKYSRCSGGVSAKVIYAPPEMEEEEKIAKLPPPKVKPPTEKPKEPFIEKVPEILKPLVPEFLKPEIPEAAPKEIPIEKLTPKQAPLAFQGKWQLLPSKPIREFVLAPLPKEIRVLAKKFPKLGETLKKIGITKITDIEKLRTVKLTLPGLKKIKEMPTEIVFAKTAGERIDFNIALTVDKKGQPQQKITTITGTPLQLVVKPDRPVKSIKGYVVFRSKKPRPTSFQFPSNRLAASLIFANPAFAKAQEKPVRVEEKLVLLEFEYIDPDGDGIYTAEIQTPLVEGEYEIITVMDYEDPELGKKEIRLITVVDPEGYVYEKDGDKETRIPGAIVSIYWLNSETKQYELWPAKEYQQENPQITNATGKYSFLVPEGSYYLKVETPGYPIYDGKPFQVKEGSGVHINIELKTKYWWLNVIDWKTILLILVIILLLYNFYRDKIREKLLRRPKKYD